MNMSRTVSFLKMMLQQHQITFPFKDESTGAQIPAENVIYNVLSTMTIPMYSQFVPWKRTCIGDLSKMECLDQSRSLYRLPKEITDTPILYVIEIKPPFNNSRATLGSYVQSRIFSYSAQATATAMGYRMAAGQMRHEPSWELAEGDTIYLYGWPRIPLQFTVACEHLPNGETIPPGCFDSFTQLAQLDLEVFTYNALKNYEGLPSAHGQVSLGIQDWAQSKSERENLLEKWRDTYHLDMGWETFM